MIALIITLLVCLGLYSTLACCKSNQIWVNRKKEYQPRMSREVLRAWRYETALHSPDPWLQPVLDEMPEPILGRHADHAE
jgi:hypothetical protein